MAELITDTIVPGSLEWYSSHWQNTFIPMDKKIRVEHWCLNLLEGKSRYQIVESETLVPWQMVGALHGLESSFNFRTYLGNGDPLHMTTVHIPAGRGPFDNWEAGAIDALKYDGLTGRSWDIPSMLLWSQKWHGNGAMKYHPGHMDAYLWACTNFETPGGYDSDRHWNPSYVSREVGVAAVFKRLIEMGVM